MKTSDIQIRDPYILPLPDGDRRMSKQLMSYIALSAPATRRPAMGSEPFFRPEIGFTPVWCRQHLEIDLVMADIEAGTPDQRVRYALELCRTLSNCKVGRASIEKETAR